MVPFIIGILLLIAGIVLVCVGDEARVGGLISIILSIVLVVVACVSIVPTGYTGVLTSFGKVDDRHIEAGLNFIAPWQSIIKMDNRTQKESINLSAFSSDIQQVDTTLSVNYHIDSNTAQTLYKTVGKEYFNTIVMPRILEDTKAVFSNYTAENLVAKREHLSTEILNLLTADMSKYGITITSLAIEDIDFTDAFTNAVEQKQVAAQNKLTAQTEQDRLTMEANAKAQREIINAQTEAEKAKIAANADLEVVKIQADAASYAGEREAEMNKRISESCNEALLDYYWIKQWNGTLPMYYGGGAETTPVIDLR